MLRPVSLHSASNRITLRHTHGADDLAACFPVISLLKPGLGDLAEWIERATEMAIDGYRILAAWDGSKILAVAGYRMMENLLYDKFLYVDYLVAVEGQRRFGLETALIKELSVIGLDEFCTRLVLESILSTNECRFYNREGLTHTTTGYIKPLISSEYVDSRISI